MGAVMRDIRGDLAERAQRIRQEIDSEHARFAALLLQLKSERDQRLEPLTAQRQAVHKLLGFAAWQHHVRTSHMVAIAGTAAAERSVRGSIKSLP
jgi:hypothetical protein